MFVGLLTPDGRVVEANQPALETFGLNREQVLGRRLDELDPFSYSRAVQDQLSRALDRAGRGEPSRYDVELRSGARSIVVELSLQPLRDASGEVAYRAARTRTTCSSPSTTCASASAEIRSSVSSAV